MLSLLVVHLLRSLKDYRPVSNLPFFSKVLERVVSQQLSGYLLNNNLLEPFQSAFRACHSTQTALTKVVNDILLNLDSNSTLVLLLLDLSTAFDTTDYAILSDKLQSGISGLALVLLKVHIIFPTIIPHQYLPMVSVGFTRALFWALCSSLYIFHLSAKLLWVMEYISTVMHPTLSCMCSYKLMIYLKSWNWRPACIQWRNGCQKTSYSWIWIKLRWW